MINISNNKHNNMIKIKVIYNNNIIIDMKHTTMVKVLNKKKYIYIW